MATLFSNSTRKDAMATARKKAKQEPIQDAGVSDARDEQVSPGGASDRRFPEHHAQFGIELRGKLPAGLAGDTAFEIILAKELARWRDCYFAIEACNAPAMASVSVRSSRLMAS
jgi:hypothetical protein